MMMPRVSSHTQVVCGDLGAEVLDVSSSGAQR